MLWALYIIDLDNRGISTKFYGLDKTYYTGISTNVGHRIGDYLFQRGKRGWVNRFWKGARKIPVYIEYIEGDKKIAMRRERIVKKKSRKKKLELINSDSNMLMGYKPCKHLILKKYKEPGEVIVPIF